jgi:hypothetical protein
MPSGSDFYPGVAGRIPIQRAPRPRAAQGSSSSTPRSPASPSRWAATPRTPPSRCPTRTRRTCWSGCAERAPSPHSPPTPPAVVLIPLSLVGRNRSHNPRVRPATRAPRADQRSRHPSSGRAAHAPAEDGRPSPVAGAVALDAPMRSSMRSRMVCLAPSARCRIPSMVARSRSRSFSVCSASAT